MQLINKYLPEYSFKEVHFCNVKADASSVIEAAAEYQPHNDRFFRSMIGLRELPMRIGSRLRGKKSNKSLPFGLHNFVMLEKQDGAGLAYGLVGQFWRPDFGLIAIPDGDTFRHFNSSGIAKLILSFSATLQHDGTTRLVTETRVFCPDLVCRLKFAPYWYLIRPVSGIIRGRILNDIKKASELTSLTSLPPK
ncbi:hypothetical protein ACFQ4Q_08610 [Lysobacter gummosus]|uniref:hypothetical protein n=1 Tax=Lysobacter gummosus TaxID=262324 RepID=UPI00363841DE